MQQTATVVQRQKEGISKDNAADTTMEKTTTGHSINSDNKEFSKEQQQQQQQKSEEEETLRKLTLWSKCHIALLHLFCAIVYTITKPFGLHKAAGAAFISSMFGVMMFIPVLMCWIIMKLIDVLIFKGFEDLVWQTKQYWMSCYAIWYLMTILTDKAPKTVQGSNHRPPQNYINWAAHQFYYYGVIEYFPIDIVPWSPEAELPTENNKQYIFGCHPHGVFCWGLFMLAAKQTPFDEKFPGLCGSKLSGLIASVLFYFPTVRDFFLEWPYIDASRKVASAALAEGRSLYIIPGGEEENVLTTQGKDIVVLSKRKGFVRLALSYGADLVPIFCAGTTDTFVTYPEKFGFRHWLQKTLKISIEIYRGRWFTSLPFRNAPQRILIGKPIPTPKPKVAGCKPDDELVEEYHSKYIAALKELHDKNVKDRPLIII